ncbi:MAG: hypothetical protein KDD45_06710 [Bdellovibrionales bacterium]|nr:hypothetical protein [Bdellovibrionales bacterium]
MSKTIKMIDHIFDVKQETKNLIQQEKNSFSFLDNDCHIKGLSWYLPENSNDKEDSLFFRLKDYFEIGFKFKVLKNETKEPLWKVEKAFIFKKEFKGIEISSNLLNFPELVLFKVYKNSYGSLLNALNLDHIDDAGYTSILYKTDQDTILCFQTKQADPWLSLRLEKILKEVRNGLS